MNKKRIDSMIPVAYEILESKEIGLIDKDGKIKRAYRGGISSFGAAVTMGSLLSAAAFFSAEKSGASYNKKLLGRVVARTAIDYLRESEELLNEEAPDSIYAFVKKHKDAKELVLDAAIAVKLAMNLFDFVDE